jgi:hypothetical protein
VRTVLENFSKGEIAEELIARVDVPSYTSAAKLARNVVILKYGGLAKRPGTRLVAKAYNSTLPVRLLPFQFSLTQAYALEMGQGYMRPAANGGMVLEQLLTITGITKDVAPTVTVANHGYSVGDQIYFNNVQGMHEINGLTGTVTEVVDANNFKVDIDTITFSTFTGDSGGIVLSSPPAAPPTPPVVPPTVTPPDPPVVGGGGSYTGNVAGGGGATSHDRPGLVHPQNA